LIEQKLFTTIITSLSVLQKEGVLTEDLSPEPQFEIPKDQNHGDIATNIALVLGSKEKRNPRELAERIKDAILNGNDEVLTEIKRVEVAGPGFINFTFNDVHWHRILLDILKRGDRFGYIDLGMGKRVQIEFVSANPTGPLHIGHARGAAVGDALSSILSAAGFDVDREYYINDYGVQMETLGKSVYTRYRERFGETVVYEDNYYQGEYIRDIAHDVAKQEGDRLLSIPEPEAVSFCQEYATDVLLRGIKQDLSDFGIEYDVWFSETSLYDGGAVNDSIETFKNDGLIYEKDDALWFNTTDYGDDKDRVVVKSDGEKTYFASDIAYHKNKFDRGFDKVINVWGADHHGYVVRMQAAVRAMGRSDGDLELILVQFVNLIRQGVPVSMSTRAGSFVTMREVFDEVGKDAMRYFMLMRSYDSHLDFDLDLATKKTQENPVYYVQYAHARIQSIQRQADEKGYRIESPDEIDFSPLVLAEEFTLIKKLRQFPEIVTEAAENLEPHRITFYIFELASLFHSYYNHHRVVTEERPLSLARLCLVTAVKTVIRNGLGLLGISAPERM
jgi:arginyl-tRNA synthetase